MPGRLNSFQRTMLDWNDLHPYNAIHAVRLEAPFDRERLRSSIAAVLRRRGIAALAVDRARETFSYFNEPAPCELTELPANSPAIVTSEIERQLNTPFVIAARFCPFRFFVAPGPDHFTLGLVYFHAVADAESVVRLLREIAASVVGDGAAAGAAPEVYPAPRDRLPAGLFGRKLMALPAQSLRMRRCARPLYRQRREGSIGAELFQLPPAALRAGLAASKRWGATLNDLFLAALLKELAPWAAVRAAGARRRVSVGCIVNLRRELNLSGDDAFGLFLGSFVVSHPAIGELALPALTRAVSAQTRELKDRRLPLATPVDLGLARFAQKFFALEHRSKFYQKNHPLWGGITNMNLNSIWKPDELPQPRDYFRAVSTGPATPLVLSLTTVGDVVNVGLSYRKTVFSPDQIAQLKAGFLAAFAGLEAAA